MKLCRIGAPGSEVPAIIDPDGLARSLVSIFGDVTSECLTQERLKSLRSLDLSTLPIIDKIERYGIPYVGVGKYVCIGLNYRAHAREAGMDIPDEPVIFMKAITALSGPDDPIIQPRGSTKLDWEVELAIVIGERASYVSEASALDHIAGYCVANDVSERAFQLQSSQWDKGKGCDSFGPLGPWLVTADEIADVQNLDLSLSVNGVRMQQGNTSDMIFSVREIVSYVSRYMTLLPGDVIATGTPVGVGMGLKPVPQYLAPGDVVELEIEGLGRQRQVVVSA